MQFTRFVRASVLPLALSLAGSVVGCGAGAQRGSPAEEKEAGKIFGEGRRKMHEQLQQSAKTGSPVPARDKYRAKPGP